MRQITKNQNLLGSLRDSIPPICLSLGYNILLFKPSHYGFRSCTWADLRTREKQKGNANRATLAVARKLVAYLMAIDRGQRNFQVMETSHCIAA